jgi:hypothetical protein
MKRLAAIVIGSALLSPAAFAQRAGEPARFAASLLDSLVFIARERQSPTGNGLYVRLYAAAANKMVQFRDSPDSAVRASSENLRIFFATASANDKRLEQLYADPANPPERSAVEAAANERDAWTARMPELVRAQIEAALLGPSIPQRPQSFRLTSRERATLASQLSKVLTTLSGGQPSRAEEGPEIKALVNIAVLLERRDLRAVDDARQ